MQTRPFSIRNTYNMGTFKTLPVRTFFLGETLLSRFHFCRSPSLQRNFSIMAKETSHEKTRYRKSLLFRDLSRLPKMESLRAGYLFSAGPVFNPHRRALSCLWQNSASPMSLEVRSVIQLISLYIHIQPWRLSKKKLKRIEVDNL